MKKMILAACFALATLSTVACGPATDTGTDGGTATDAGAAADAG